MSRKTIVMFFILCMIAALAYLFSREDIMTETMVEPIAPLILVTEVTAATEVTKAEHMQMLSIAQPMNDVSVPAPGFNIFGTSDPEKGLYINGLPVNNRTEEGFFSIFVDIALGNNTFVLSQDAQEDVIRIINRLPDTLEPAHEVMERAILTSVFPAQAEYVSSGDTIVFEAIAPIGASLTVDFNGETLILSPEHKTHNFHTGQIYATTFSASHKVTGRTGEDTIIDLGQPLYLMEFGGQTMSSSGADIRLINENAPFYATVTAKTAWTFPGASTDGGSDWSLTRGQRALVRAISGGGEWVRLDSGMWIQRENVYLRFESKLINNVLSNGRYVRGTVTDSIKWDAIHYPAVRATFDSDVLKIYFSMQKEAPAIDLSDFGDMFFNEMISGIYNGMPYYAFTVREGVNVEGFYTSFSNGEFMLNIRRRRELAEGNLPLSGFTFVIDAGHGDHDYGALGPKGRVMAEKCINLANAKNLALRLEELGATVVQVRETDVFLTLQERTEISRKLKPDMFISMHADSTAETTDATNIHGASFWYRNPNSRPLAEHFAYELHGINPMTTRGAHANQANFYVCRPTWTPSIIVEASFMNNIHDFAWMINYENQQILAGGIVRAILSYYDNL